VRLGGTDICDKTKTKLKPNRLEISPSFVEFLSGIAKCDFAYFDTFFRCVVCPSSVTFCTLFKPFDVFRCHCIKQKSLTQGKHRNATVVHTLNFSQNTHLGIIVGACKLLSMFIDARMR